MTNPADPSQLLPLARAAAELQVHGGTLRAWVRRGAPVMRRGAPGRGHAALFDVGALRAWRHGAAGTSLRVIAAQIPELLADAVYRAFTGASGPHKRALAGELGGAWILGVTALLDRLREDDETIPQLSPDFPEKIVRLRTIFLDSGTVIANSTHRNQPHDV